MNLGSKEAQLRRTIYKTRTRTCICAKYLQFQYASYGWIPLGPWLQKLGCYVLLAKVGGAYRFLCFEKVVSESTKKTFLLFDIFQKFKKHDSLH